MCACCDVHRLYDRVAERRLDLLYSNYYPAADPSLSELERQLTNSTFQSRRARLDRCLGGRERRILEIGCGDGNFLAVLRRVGWQVYGSEFGADVAALVQRRHQIPVFVGDIAAISPDRPFAVVAAYHVLEHVYHPITWLQRIHQRIEPDGLLHLQVPNDASLTQYLTGRACALIVFPQHVYFYTPRTLRSLLERTGFTVLTTTTWDPWHGPGVLANSLTHVARRLTTGQLPWTDRLDERRCVDIGTPAGSAERRVLRSLARRALDAASVPLARAEAALRHGAVVDIIAKRNGG